MTKLNLLKGGIIHRCPPLLVYIIKPLQLAPVPKITDKVAIQPTSDLQDKAGGGVERINFP